MTYKIIIKKSEDLITTREQTRAGFINFALEKNRRSTPLIESAKSLKVLASKAKAPKDLLKLKDIYPDAWLKFDYIVEDDDEYYELWRRGMIDNY